jgi:hypothetical protein
MSGFAVKYYPGTEIVAGVRVWDDEDTVPEDHVWWDPETKGEPPKPVDSPEVVEANALLEVSNRTRQANLQVIALQGRVDSINEAIEEDDVLPEEVAELPVRQEQLTQWKQYRKLLGRVKTSAGWFESPAWPEAPDLYAEEAVSLSK